MSSSKPFDARQVPPPPASRGATPYARFIPREELQDFSSWTPEAFAEPADGERDHPPRSGVYAAPRERRETATGTRDPETPIDWNAEVSRARQAGYQDGYRDGLVALESFKESFAQQMSGQFGALVGAFEGQLGALEQTIAGAVAKVATQVARQVVRRELATRPELVAHVAQEAVHAVLMSARQIVVQVHPADQALITHGAADALAARGARLVAQPAIARGGCLIETDAGTIDARIESRWLEATQALGTGVGWDDAAPSTDAEAEAADPPDGFAPAADAAGLSASEPPAP